MRSFSILAVVFAASTLTPRAIANGRFPESLRMVEDPRDPNRLLLSGTFGLLTTADRGQNWYHLCERAFAFEFLEGDPMLELLPDGTLLSGIYVSLNRSSDCGCTWQAALGESAIETVWDITVDTSAPQKVIALLDDATTLPERPSFRESEDSGRTWRKLADLPPHVIDAMTVDIAPSDPRRLYATAISRPEPAIFRGALFSSKDRGATWEERAIPGTGPDAMPYLAAVHPANPDALFVRTDEWHMSNVPAANDALLYSNDGGASWRELIRKGAKLLGFALSPDGQTVLAGFGDPLQPSGRTTAPEDLGIYKASTTDFVFQKIYAGMVSCLRWTNQGLYACNTEFNPYVSPSDFELGFAPNANFTLATANPFAHLLSLRNVRGPLGCAAAVCADAWTAGTQGSAPVCEQFRASCQLPVMDAGSACDPGGGPPPPPTDGGAGAKGDAGRAPDGAAGARGTNRDNSADGSGCGCRVSSDRSRSVGPWLAALTAFGFMRRRRRRTGHVR